MTKRIWLICLMIVAVLSVAVPAASLTKEPLTKPTNPPTTPYVEIPIDNDCLGNCCVNSGGEVHQENNGYTCYIDDNDPMVEIKLNVFGDCASQC